jgi:hypothetical protein
MTFITLDKTSTGWTATFRGTSSPLTPNNVALPLPFTSAAPAEMVRADLRSRFPDAFFITKARAR